MSSAGLNLPLRPHAGYILTVWQWLEPFSDDRVVATGTERIEGERKSSASQNQQHSCDSWYAQGGCR